MQRRIGLIIEYDGTNYNGWQAQREGASIQQTVENAVQRITGACACVFAAGRTDAGVHALAQTAHFDTCSEIPGSRFTDALNANLPADIVIKCSADMPQDFHARFSAVGKHYRYVVNNTRSRPAIDRYRQYWVPMPLNVEAMKDASKHLIGEHDFSAFCASGSEVKSKVRKLWKIDVAQNEGIITIDVYGAGFLRHMVRVISGTLVNVGKGKIGVRDIPDILYSRQRPMAGVTAPSHGLYMVRVYYPYEYAGKLQKCNR